MFRHFRKTLVVSPKNPQFGFRLLHLIVARMQTNVELSQGGAVS